ncbi:MAG: hypothetical protein OEW18_14690 [Candidatus Aminicenantes bacterium]|nr:hypothetical protein [Candidatus Aminicenantes bacterium]
MASIGILPFLLTLSLISQTTRTIEKAFFQDDPQLLFSLLSTQGHINISLPEPISFSDQMSPEQAYFFFRQIYATYSTFEFYADSDLPVLAKGGSFIFKARWSFKNKRNNNQYVLQAFFRLIREQPPRRGSPLLPWRITEIKAETL